jgi:nucleoid-associated protein YejK
MVHGLFKGLRLLRQVLREWRQGEQPFVWHSRIAWCAMSLLCFGMCA